MKGSTSPARDGGAKATTATLRTLLLRSALSATMACAFDLSARAGALSDLDQTFRDTYGEASASKLAEMKARAPLLVNRFGQIALYRPKVPSPEVYSMDVTPYLTARTVAHSAITLLIKMQRHGFGLLDAEFLSWLSAFQAQLTRASQELNASDGSPSAVKSMQTGLLDDVQAFSRGLSASGTVEPADFERLRGLARQRIDANLALAAESQMEQFRIAIISWKERYPDLDWDHAAVVVLGNHQARRRYAQMQFFDWMLKDTPTSEDKVVYAETLAFPPDLEKDPAAGATDLLAKVMLDKVISAALLGDPTAMQSDVLGPAAEHVISEWSTP